MASQSETFFTEYADALNSNDPILITEFHVMPSVFVTDSAKIVCNDQAKVVEVYQRMLESLNNNGELTHMPQVNQAMRLSESVIFCNVRWQCMDKDDKLVFSSTCSYTLQNDSAGKLKIIVVVLDGEEKFLSKVANLDD